jgi:hypothetical protein
MLRKGFSAIVPNEERPKTNKERAAREDFTGFMTKDE